MIVTEFCQHRYKMPWTHDRVWPQACLAVEMKYHVKTLFIFFSFHCCKHCLHSKVCILNVCFSSAVYTLHMVDCGSLQGDITLPEWMKWEDTHQRMFAVLSNLTWKKEVHCSNRSVLNIAHKAKPPWSCLCSKGAYELNWIWWGDHFLTVLWRLGSVNSQMEMHRSEM